MLIRPELAALRNDDAPQRRAQAALGAALDRWHAEPLVRAANAELVRWGCGADLEDLPVLSTLFASGEDAAAQFAGNLIAQIVAELSINPIGQSPLRHYLDDATASVSLLRHGTTVLSLLAFDGQAMTRAAPPTSARFVPCETWDAVLAGSAEADVFTLHDCGSNNAGLSRSDFRLVPGMVQRRSGQTQTVQFKRVASCLVLLRLQRRTDNNGVSREYAIEDGTLLHQSAASPRDSRWELTAALLGRMGRTDAAPMLAAMAEEEGSAGMRWQVLRECLGLDTRRGFTALCRIAADPTDPLARHAGSLRTQLIETHPQLGEIDPCLVN
ncbi:hypothetical protein [Novosphingobium sp.]|uniref:hypothetical protein n=1 Tax=Novosphingobium sp. TaxID=1874826 RepID=UPI0025F11AB1|nr:hypothetical protein [Novosphingobium sp.]